MYHGPRGRGRGQRGGFTGFRPPVARPQENLSKTNVYIRGLLPNTTDSMLFGLCQQYGDIVSVKAVTDQNNVCRGYGFVLFAQADQAQAAVAGLTQIGLEPSMARENERTRDGGPSGSTDYDPTSVYIHNGLPTTIDDMQLATLFYPFGTVVHARILRKPDGCSRGVGFVRLDTAEAATRAIQSLGGTWLQGASSAVELRNAESKAARESRRGAKPSPTTEEVEKEVIEDVQMPVAPVPAENPQPQLLPDMGTNIGMWQQPQFPAYGYPPPFGMFPAGGPGMFAAAPQYPVQPKVVSDVPRNTVEATQKPENPGPPGPQMMTLEEVEAGMLK